MLRFRHFVTMFALVASAGAFASPSEAHADESDVAKLQAAGHSLKWNYLPTGKADRYGHAEVLVHTPAVRVKKVATDYAGYKELVPRKFNNARVIGKDGDQTDIYMQVPIAKGLVTMWQVMRFGPVKEISPGVEGIEAKFVKGGNVTTANLVISWRPVDEETTILKVDLLILPTIPATQSMIDEELRDAAGDAIDALRDKSERINRFAPNAPPASSTN